MRYSGDQYVNGKLLNGYDYDNQAWVENGVYLKCGHSESCMDCHCFGKIHEGEEAQ